MKILRDGMVTILPPREGACRVCGDMHNPRDPHNVSSLLYQHRFRKRNGRYPTWADAMSHCTRRTKERWMERLRKRGIRITAEEVFGEKDGK